MEKTIALVSFADITLIRFHGFPYGSQPFLTASGKSTPTSRFQL